MGVFTWFPEVRGGVALIRASPRATLMKVHTASGGVAVFPHFRTVAGTL